MATHAKGSHSGGISVDNIRHRSQKAVDYYKKVVQPIYQDKRETSVSPHDSRSSADRQNGSYVDDRKSDFKDTDDDLYGLEDGFLKRGGHRATVHGTGPTSKYWSNHSHMSYKDKRSPESMTTYSSKRFGHGLHRSNSNSEMDSIEYIDADETSIHNRSLHRDYGSTSSLDMIGSNSVHNDSFFDMLNDFRHVNLDQRSPAPAKLQELLRGGYDMPKGQRLQFGKVSNGSVPNDKQSHDEMDSPRSKLKFKQKGDRKSRAKSITAETRPGIFTKFRGKQEVESGSRTPENIDVDMRADERLRSKAFVHYDCQSIGFSLQEVINRQNQAITAKNTSTGASAASGASRDSIAQDKDSPDPLADGEEGDNKSNGLVLSCQFFRNELGGEEERTISLGKSSTDQKSRTSLSQLSQSAISVPSRSPACCGVSILDSSPTPSQLILPHVVLHRGHVIEYYDDGASYYRHYFHGVDHQNYFGIDEHLGPVAVSIRREKLEERENKQGKAEYGQYHYRIIFRTSELTTLRGSIIEDAIPSSGSRLSTSRGVLPKDVLEFILPELQTSCLRLGTATSKTSDQLLKLDEQGLTKTYKVGIMFCKAGQSTEEEMYNNEHSSQAFEEFLTCIGQKVKLKGFDKYRAQLDNKTNSTGTHSIYATFNNCEIMFHVSTMLPYTQSNKQQLLRKRHIGNDIVTIVFQEPGALPFTPKTVRSQFQHVFIIVRAHNPCSSNVQYSVAVSRSKDVPPFGPHIPDNAFFPKSADFADFILAKVINAESAAHRSDKFTAMATRTRTEYLKDLAQNYVTATTVDSGSKLSKFGLGSGKKKEKTKQKVIPDMFSSAAIVWNIVAEDVGKSSHIDCLLGISEEVLVIIEESTKDVVFTVHCGAIIGWTSQATSIRIFYNQGESISFKPQSGEMEEMGEICARLQAISDGCETVEMTLRRNGMGQLGFHIELTGIVTDVEKNGFAWEAGIRRGCRLVEICKVASITLTHDGMVDLLRTSTTVKVVVIKPLEDGTARGVPTLYTNCHSSSMTTLNAALQATEHVHRRQKEARNQSNAKSTEYLPGNGRETPPTRRSTNSDDFYANTRRSTNSDEFLSTTRRSSSSNEYTRNGVATPTRLSSNSDDYLTLFDPNDSQLINRTSSSDHLFSSKIDGHGRMPSIMSSSEQLSFHHRELSKVSSSSSSEQSCHMREITISDQKEQILHKRLDSQLSSTSSEQVSSASPLSKESSKFYENQKGSLTLPLQKKSSTAPRGDPRPSPLKGLTPQHREFRQVSGTSSLNRGLNLHNVHSEPSLPSKHDGRGSSFDEGYNTSSLRSDNYLRADDIRHERSGSRDSGGGDYASIGVYVELDKLGFLPAGSVSSSRGTWTSRPYQSNSRGTWQDESIDSGCHGSHLHISESAPNMTSTLQRGQGHQNTSGYQPPPPRKVSVPFELGVQHGNISQELLKQQQNTKFLLSQGHSVTGPSQNSSVNLSDMSFSSGSSHNSGANTMNRPVGDHVTSYSKVDDVGAVSRKRADIISTNNKGRPGFAQKRHQGDHSPLSSENSSPRSSHRNLSGMSSEESLNTRLRPGVSTSTKQPKIQSPNNLEEELMRLIDPSVSDTEIRGFLVSKGMLKATEKPRTAKLKRTMSEESLHSMKGSVLTDGVDSSLSDVIFSTTNKHSKSHRISPRTTLDNILSSGRPRAGHSTDSLSSTVPLPESTSGLEWSSLVNVATKAIEGTGDKSGGAKPKKTPPKEEKKEDLTRKASVLTGPTSYSSSTPVWRSVVANPQMRIQELELKVNQLENDLDKERKENAALEAEVQELRTENERLQEESQTAAAKLRKFTEWFFTTIDRQ